MRYLGLPLGIGIFIALIIHQDLQNVLSAIQQAGLILLWLIPFHVFPLLLDAVAWYLLLSKKVNLFFLWWVAFVREAVNRLLPVVGIGGEIIGIRLALWQYANRYRVTASVIVEVLITVIVQYVFAGLSLVWIAATRAHASIYAIILGLLLSLPIPLLLFFLIKRGGIFLKIEQFASRILGEDHPFLKRIYGRQLDQEIDRLMRKFAVLVRAFLWQFAGYALGALENYFALRVLGCSVSIWDALAIEGLTQAIRQTAFIIPSGLGVQEASIVLLAQLFGISHDIALSLALIKRMREVIFGVISLLTWQFAELILKKKKVSLTGK